MPDTRCLADSNAETDERSKDQKSVQQDLQTAFEITEFSLLRFQDRAFQRRGEVFLFSS